MHGSLAHEQTDTIPGKSWWTVQDFLNCLQVSMTATLRRTFYRMEQVYKIRYTGKFDINDVCLYRVRLRMYSFSPSAPTATSPVEELPRIFSRQSKVAWNTAQELYDVGYVIYKAEGGRRRREDRRRKRNSRRENSRGRCVRIDEMLRGKEGGRQELERRQGERES